MNRRRGEEQVRTIVVMGVSGCGKSTIAQRLGRATGWAVIEGDAYHPMANRAKMSAGIALTDADREPWLDALRRRISVSPGSVVVACSALRRSYRDRLCVDGRSTYFIHLHGDDELLAERLESRRGHFMSPDLLGSQLATLEPLGSDEPGAVLDIALEPSMLEHLALAAIFTERNDVAHRPS